MCVGQAALTGERERRLHRGKNPSAARRAETEVRAKRGRRPDGDRRTVLGGTTLVDPFQFRKCRLCRHDGSGVLGEAGRLLMRQCCDC